MDKNKATTPAISDKDKESIEDFFKSLDESDWYWFDQRVADAELAAKQEKKMTETPKPQAPKPTTKDVKAPLVKRPFVPTPHMTQRPFADLDLMMHGKAAKRSSK